jgi:hypothetical protein
MKCPSCGAENSDDAQFCNLCLARFNQAPPPAGPPPDAPATPPPATAPKRSWFQRHLNWTWVLAQVAATCLVIAWMAVFVMVFVVTDDADPQALGTAIASAMLSWNFAWIISMLAPFVAGAWVLSEKGRSYAWLLLFFLPFGFIFFLLLGNSNLLALPKSAPPAPARAGLQSSSRYSY